MYQVMDDMVRLEYIGEMDLYAYTDEDIDYMKKLLANDRELISEGAAFTLYTSCKYLIVKLTAYYQKYCTENLKVDIPKEVRILYYNYARKILPEVLTKYQDGDIEEYTKEKLSVLYKVIISKKLNIEF